MFSDLVFELKHTFNQIVSGTPNIYQHSGSEIAGDYA